MNVVAGAVGVVGTVVVVVALLETLLSCTFTLLGVTAKKSVSAKSAKVMKVSTTFAE